MNNLPNYFIESGICIACLALLYLLLFQKDKSFVFNRYYLLSAVIFSLILPLIEINISPLASQAIMPTLYLDELIFGQADHTSYFSFNWILLLYGLISSILLLSILYKIVTINKITGFKVIHSDYHLVELAHSKHAFTFLQTIYMGDQIDPKYRKAILKHELTHARQRHSLDILFLEVVCAIFWINPIFRLIRNLAETNHEFLADQSATLDTNSTSYIGALSASVLSQMSYSPGLKFYSSNIIKRIKMLNTSKPNIMKTKHFSPILLIVALFTVFSCENIEGQLDDLSDAQAATKINKLIETSDSEIFDKVDEQPMPPKGMEAFYQWVETNLKYPEQAKKEGTEGRVFVQFIVDKEGNLTNIQTLKGIGSGCDQAAIDLLAQSPRWTPGKQKGKEVRVRMILPITFKLS